MKYAKTIGTVKNSIKNQDHISQRKIMFMSYHLVLKTLAHIYKVKICFMYDSFKVFQILGAISMPTISDF